MVSCLTNCQSLPSSASIRTRAASMAVLPSIPTPRFTEPWGLVCNEAMHQGRPMVASSAVGAVAGGLVRDGDTGLVVGPGDTGALARAMYAGATRFGFRLVHYSVMGNHVHLIVEAPDVDVAKLDGTWGNGEVLGRGRRACSAQRYVQIWARDKEAAPGHASCLRSEENVQGNTFSSHEGDG